MMFVSHIKHVCGASTACYGDSITLLYVDDVGTSKETHLRTSTTYYWYSFIFMYR
jgi:hypothetical protein